MDSWKTKDPPKDGTVFEYKFQDKDCYGVVCGACGTMYYHDDKWMVIRTEEPYDLENQIEPFFWRLCAESAAAGVWNPDMSEMPEDEPAIILLYNYLRDDGSGKLIVYAKEKRICSARYARIFLTGSQHQFIAWARLNVPDGKES